MRLITRKPTGRPAWPIMLIAGTEKVGKSWAAAQASASDLIGRTFWVPIGEDAPDELGALPGARFEIVEHDGTYRGILDAVRAAKDEPPVDGKPNLIILDSGSRLWALLSDMAQAEANRRDRIKAEKYKRRPSEEDVQITPDLWNTATGRWTDVFDLLRDHQGPSIITARLDYVMVMGDDKKPTDKKVWKVQGQKGLPYDVGVVVEMPKRGDAFLTGVRSVRLAKESTDRRQLRNFTVDQLWRDLGLAAEPAGPRTHPRANGEESQAVEDEVPERRAQLLDRLRGLTDNPGAVAAQWQADHDHPITTTNDLVSLAALVAAAQAQKEQQK